jgi:hypothetical protein
MARKLNELNLLEEMRGQPESLNPRLTPQFVPCFVPFRPQPRIHPPKRRLEIAIEVKPDTADTEEPSPVKIMHTV